jgi:protein-tyrosine phosphatase
MCFLTVGSLASTMSDVRRPKAARAAKSRPKSPAEFAPGLFVGGWNDAVRFEGARFCVLDEAPPDMPPATHLPIYDENGDRPIVSNLNRLADAMKAARSKNEPVLVFCGHGVRRSPLAAAWYLHRVEQLPLDEAYDRIRAVRPRIEHARDWIGDVGGLD